jgi:hypothetical protein
MTEITNNTRETLNFVVGVKDGQPVTEDVKAGETKDIAVDPEANDVKGRSLAGAITVGASRRRASAKSES